MCQDQSARMIIKRGSGVPTIPVSADHRNGDWIATDIYEGEFYQDTDTGLVYQRTGSTIVTASGKPLNKTYKAIITQVSTNDPTGVELENTLGVVTLSRNGVGDYEATCTGAFAGGANKVFISSSPLKTITTEVRVYRENSNVVKIRTYASGVLTDALLPSSEPLSLLIEVYP